MPDRVRAAAGAGPVGPPHWLPSRQMDVRDDGGALPDEEENGAQRHVLQPLSLRAGNRAGDKRDGEYTSACTMALSSSSRSCFLASWLPVG